MVETHKRKRKNTVITKITLTISNAEHIKQTLSTNRPYRHQQHLQKKFSKRLWSCTDGNSIWKKYLHCSITTVRAFWHPTATSPVVVLRCYYCLLLVQQSWTSLSSIVAESDFFILDVNLDPLLLRCRASGPFLAPCTSDFITLILTFLCISDFKISAEGWL